MSLSNVFVKILGVVLALVGLFLVLSAVGIGAYPLKFIDQVWSLVIGALLIGAGIIIVRGGTITA